MKPISPRSVVLSLLLVFASLFVEPQAWSATTVYVQTNLVSDIPGLAQSTDPNLKNPWGVSYSATSPFWVSDAATNLSTLYQGTGSTVNARVVAVPGGPTGEIQNSTTDFVEPNGKTASFIFASLNGSIYSWNGTDNTTAVPVASVTNASFTGLALGNNGSGNFLYAANSAGLGSIEVFSGNFAHVTPAGSFKDPNLPPGLTLFGNTGYVPYNIQNLNGQLYVEYASFSTGSGAVAVFDLNGNFIREAVAAGTPQLRLPWGVAIAPAGFGSYANDLLVGNFGNGQINAFDPMSGAFLGTLTGFNGPLVNSGLWAISVRTGGTFNTSGVYITAGINNQADGLFALIAPSTATTVAITTPSPLPAAKSGTPYSQTLAASGGTPGYSNWTVSNGSLPPGLSLNSQTGALSGTAYGITGTFNFTVSVTDSTGATGIGSFQLPVQPASTSGTMSRIGSFAQVASGGGWKTSMTLINTSGATVNAQVNLYADGGTPLTLSLSFPQFSSSTSGSSVSLTLSPNDSIVITSAGSATTTLVGWADVQATGPLGGYATYTSGSSGGPALEATELLDTRLSNSLTLPYDNTNGQQTAVALANQSGTAQTITVTLLDQTGTQLTTSQMKLAAYGHSSFFVGSLFSQLGNQLGIIQFQGTAGVTGIGLLFGPTGSFASIPIVK